MITPKMRAKMAAAAAARPPPVDPAQDAPKSRVWSLPSEYTSAPAPAQLSGRASPASLAAAAAAGALVEATDIPDHSPLEGAQGGVPAQPSPAPNPALLPPPCFVGSQQAEHNPVWIGGDWKCPNKLCASHNFARNPACFRCGTSRSFSAQPWTCLAAKEGKGAIEALAPGGTCGCHNPAFRMTCARCNRPRPDSTKPYDGPPLGVPTPKTLPPPPSSVAPAAAPALAAVARPSGFSSGGRFRIGKKAPT